MLEEDLRHRGPARGAQKSWCSPATPSPAAASATGLGPLCSHFRPARKRPQPQSPHGGGTPPSLGAFLSSCWAQGPSLSQSSEVWGPSEVGRGLGALPLDLPGEKQPWRVGVRPCDGACTGSRSVRPPCRQSCVTLPCTIPSPRLRHHGGSPTPSKSDILSAISFPAAPTRACPAQARQAAERWGHIWHRGARVSKATPLQLYGLWFQPASSVLSLTSGSQKVPGQKLSTPAQASAFPALCPLPWES